MRFLLMPLVIVSIFPRPCRGAAMSTVTVQETNDHIFVVTGHYEGKAKVKRLEAIYVATDFFSDGCMLEDAQTQRKFYKTTRKAFLPQEDGEKFSVQARLDEAPVDHCAYQLLTARLVLGDGTNEAFVSFHDFGIYQPTAEEGITEPKALRSLDCDGLSSGASTAYACGVKTTANEIQKAYVRFHAAGTRITDLPIGDLSAAASQRDLTLDAVKTVLRFKARGVLVDGTLSYDPRDFAVLERVYVRVVSDDLPESPGGSGEVTEVVCQGQVRLHDADSVWRVLVTSYAKDLRKAAEVDQLVDGAWQLRDKGDINTNVEIISSDFVIVNYSHKDFKLEVRPAQDSTLPSPKYVGYLAVRVAGESEIVTGQQWQCQAPTGKIHVLMTPERDDLDNPPGMRL